MNGMIKTVKPYFLSLQEQICEGVEALNSGNEVFSKEVIENAGRGFSIPRILAGGGHIEKAAVNFTHSTGDNLPVAATERRPEMTASPFEAASVSVIIHPRNPFVPTTHMNLRFFCVGRQTVEWYFGGGFDLTPHYGFDEDAVAWHENAARAAGKYYKKMKDDCDAYFFLPHREEHRGIGGLFFDDFALENFQDTFRFVKKVGDVFFPAYRDIFKRRNVTPFSERHRAFQLHRRARYAEFNLLIDRGTRYGLETKRRVESVLASMPPMASWIYNYQADEGSQESQLINRYLQPKDWLDT